ncbi:MAG: Mg2+ and Co2+ transporter CorB [Clostridiaceae bacterium]|nr:Mg2+ and Co2+ transporter CorB [Clostridiaceae bacterium]
MVDHYRHPADDKKIKFKSTTKAAVSKKSDAIWILTITIVSFIVSAALTVASSKVLQQAGIITALIVIFIIVLVNIFFDIIGTSVTAAEEKPFHAMASRKIFGAKQAIRLIRNADKVSNVCNDVIGDICGIISGAAGAYIIIRIIGSQSNTTVAELIMTGLITALTVGGKALGKTIALRNSNYIIYKVSVIISFIKERLFIFRRKGKLVNEK